MLERALQAADSIDTLEDIVLACHGAVENRRAETERQRAEWQAIFDTARTRCDDYPALLNWVNALAGDGTLKRLSRGDIVLAAKLLDSAFQSWGGARVKKCFSRISPPIARATATLSTAVNRLPPFVYAPSRPRMASMASAAPRPGGRHGPR